MMHYPPNRRAHHAVLPTKTSLHCIQFTGISIVFFNASSHVSSTRFVNMLVLLIFIAVTVSMVSLLLITRHPLAHISPSGRCFCMTLHTLGPISSVPIPIGCFGGAGWSALGVVGCFASSGQAFVTWFGGCLYSSHALPVSTRPGISSAHFAPHVGGQSVSGALEFCQSRCLSSQCTVYRVSQLSWVVDICDISSIFLCFTPCWFLLCDSLQFSSVGYMGGIGTCGRRLSLPWFQPWEKRAWWWSRFKEPPMSKFLSLGLLMLARCLAVCINRSMTHPLSAAPICTK